MQEIRESKQSWDEAREDTEIDVEHRKYEGQSLLI